MVPVTPRIVNDVSCETQINHEINFAWQAQFICDADQSSQSFCVLGAVFGEVGG